MKRRFITNRALAFFAGLAGILLQSYLFICGCSTPADSGNFAGSPAKTLYSAKCGSCHRLLPPQDYTSDQWRLYVDKYGKKMTQLQKQTVLEYLESRSADSQEGQQGLSH
ncbi:MAG: hypothetical protein ACYSOQ_10215 [Planctomycetota bacterium]|jgi:hypothetical protein